jgi:hypothetical protein
LTRCRHAPEDERRRTTIRGEAAVLVDHRTYKVRPGGMSRQLAIYEKHGLAPQTRHLGSPLAFLVAETGELNTYVHLWAYEDAGDRATRRAAMMADPDWQTFLKEVAAAGLLVEQRTSLMVPAAFAPLRPRP